MDVYAASLSQVVAGTGPDVYRDPKAFFDNTYPTDGLKTTIREVFTRLGKHGAGSPVVKLETNLGGGKTHALIALYHLAKHGSDIAPGKFVKDLSFQPLKVAAVVGTELSADPSSKGPSTLWGEIANQLGTYPVIAESDRSRTSPGESTLRQVFGDKDCLVLIDEVALYLAKASAQKVGDSTLARQTIIFLQELTEAASNMDNLCVVITSLGKRSVFEEQTEDVNRILDADVQQGRAEEAIKDAESLIGRKSQSYSPTKSEEFPRVVQHRLFHDINRSAARSVSKEYHQGLNKDGVKDYMPQRVTDPKYLNYFEDSYPFHPELMQILRTKTTSIPQFNQTRGVLRLLGALVRHVWNKKISTPLIHTHHIDFQESVFYEELIPRLDKGEYKAAVTQDIADVKIKPRAANVDEEFSQPYGTWLCTTAFLHSLIGYVGGDVRKGANEAELYLALYQPGLDPKVLEQALGRLEETCFYMVKQGSMYYFQTEANIIKVIEEAKDLVERTHVLKEVRKRIEQIYGRKRIFDPILLQNEPSAIPDNTSRPKLVVMDFAECSTTGGSSKVPDLVQSIYDKSGTQGKPRIYTNNLLFLVVDKDEQEKMEVKAREFLALKKLVEDIEAGAPAVADVSPNQKNWLKEKLKEAELYLKVAVIVAHKHLFIPTRQKSLDGTSGRPLRKLTRRLTDTEVEQNVKTERSEEDTLLNFLRNAEAGRSADDEPWAPEFIIERLWPKRQEALDGEEFKGIFYKNPDAGLVFAEDLVLRAQARGVKEGKWYVILGNQFYDKTNAHSFTGITTGDANILLIDSDAGRDAWKQFNCPKCRNRRTECTCEVQACPRCGKTMTECACQVPACPTCGKALSECSGHVDAELEPVRNKTMNGIVSELEAALQDHEIDEVIALRLKAHDRNALAKLVLAIPQFQGAEPQFNLEATLNKEPVGGNFLQIKYRGDANGFRNVKSTFLDYEGRESFSMCELQVNFTWKKPVSREEYLKMLRKVAEFTGEGIYDATTTPAQEAKEEVAA